MPSQSTTADRDLEAILELGKKIAGYADSLVEEALALAWTVSEAARQALRPAITRQEGRIVKIDYPLNRGSMEFAYDAHGITKVTRNGQPLLERLSDPAGNGESGWRVTAGEAYRGILSLDNDGNLKFAVANGDLYIFKADGTRTIRKSAQGDGLDRAAAEAQARLHAKPRTLHDLRPWFDDAIKQFDEDGNKKLSWREIESAIVFTGSQGKDSDIAVTMLAGFEVVANLGEADNELSATDLSKIDPSKVADNRGLEAALQRMLEKMQKRVQTLNTRLFGEFSRPSDAIKPEAVAQGQIGDCWLMGSIAAVADTMPHLIEKMIKENPDGTFTVTFPGRPDKPQTVEPPTPLELLLYAHGNKHGSWVAVLEKAAARLLNSEAGLLKRKKEINILHGGDPGVALKLLTGEKVLSLSGREADLVEKLAVASQWGLPLVCASEPLWTDAEHDARGVYYSHLYMLKYDPLQKEVIVRNPWGGTKRAEPSHADGTPLDGAADGAFRMSLADFRKSFPYVWAVVP